MWSSSLLVLSLFPLSLSLRRKISGGTDASPNSLPFMVRLRIQGAQGRKVTCGGSLIHEKFFISALHCFINEEFDFWRNCFRRGETNGRCFAVVREHYVNAPDEGEVRINILKIYETPESSDLVIGELERKVSLDDKAEKIVVSSQTLRPGDVVHTAGWGLFGPTGHLSNVLRRTELQVSIGGEGEIVKTKVGRSISGISIDACSGDSGGPLLKWSDALDTFVLHATLNGGGYDCILNTTDGDGVWNSVFPHIKWIDNFVKGISPAVEELEEGDAWEPAAIGKIVLQHSESQIGDTLHEGSVFLDGRPVCDNAWDEKEAQVVCRSFGYSVAVARTSSFFGRVQEGTEFGISDLRCTGEELSLLHCPHTSLRPCGVNKVAGVTCIKGTGKSPITSTAGTAPSPTTPKRSTTRATTTEITTALGATAALENLNTQFCAIPRMHLDSDLAGLVALRIRYPMFNTCLFDCLDAASCGCIKCKARHLFARCESPFCKTTSEKCCLPELQSGQLGCPQSCDVDRLFQELLKYCEINC